MGRGAKIEYGLLCHVNSNNEKTSTSIPVHRQCVPVSVGSIQRPRDHVERRLQRGLGRRGGGPNESRSLKIKEASTGDYKQALLASMYDPQWQKNKKS